MVDYDKLTIEVWTDGSLKPYEALSIAAKVMTGHLELLFIDLSETAKNTQVMVEKKKNLKKKKSFRDVYRRLRIVSKIIQLFKKSCYIYR